MTPVEGRPVVGLPPNGAGQLPAVSAAGSEVAVTVTSAPRALSPGERACAWGLGVMLMALGVLGFVNSFREVATAVEPSFGSLAWSAPIGIDLGIAVFTGLDLFLAHLGMRMRLLRLLPWSLVGVTVALNVAQPLGRGDMIGAGTHGVLPVLWIAAVEVTTHVMRHRAGLGQSAQQRRAAGQMDRVRASRWLLAPVSTLRIRRLMILWEERSYQAALERWMARSRSRGHMARRHGRVKWRWKAPIDQRLDYRYAQLSLATVSNDESAGQHDAPTLSSRGARNRGGSRRRQGAAPKGGTRVRRAEDTDPVTAGRRLDDDALVAVVHEIAEEFAAQARALTTRALDDELVRRGIRASRNRRHLAYEDVTGGKSTHGQLQP